MKKYLVPGLILILAGVYFLIEALPGVSLPFGAFFALVGAALLVGRLFARGKYGLSIAGFLLLCFFVLHNQKWFVQIFLILWHSCSVRCVLSVLDGSCPCNQFYFDFHSLFC